MQALLIYNFYWLAQVFFYFFSRFIILLMLINISEHFSKCTDMAKNYIFKYNGKYDPLLYLKTHRFPPLSFFHCKPL